MRFAGSLSVLCALCSSVFQIFLPVGMRHRMPPSIQKMCRDRRTFTLRLRRSFQCDVTTSDHAPNIVTKRSQLT